MWRRFVSYVAARLAALAAPDGGLPLNLNTLTHIESLGRLRLTPGVQVLEAEACTSARFETHFTARLGLPPAQLDDFLAGTLVRTPLSPETSALPRDVLFRTRPMRSFLAGQGAQGQTRQTVLVDTSDPARYVVYITTHSR